MIALTATQGKALVQLIASLPGEEWAEVPDSKGRYYVSTEGRVYSVPRERTRGGICKHHPDRHGYPRVGLHYRGRHQMIRVHLLVARTFIGPPQDGLEVRHLDGNPGNARLENLAYGTHAENMQDMVAHGRSSAVDRTHCVNGHELTDDNVRVYPRKGRPRPERRCVTCTSESAKARWARGERW